MRWGLIVLGVILLLLVALCLLRVGVLVTLDEEVFVHVRAGSVRVQAVPAKAKKRPEKPKKEKPKKPKKEKPEKKPFPKPDLEDIRSAIRTLWPPLIRALDRTRRGIKLKPFTLAVIFGGADDPASAAQTMGYAELGVWSGMPVLERVLDIPDPAIHLETDFLAESAKVRGQVGVSVRVGTLLGVGFGIAVPALIWLLKFFRKHSKRDNISGEKTSDTKEQSPAA